MPPLENALWPTFGYLAIAALCAYYGGRIHQWYIHSMDRDVPFREGYEHGYDALFAVAIAAHRTPAATGRPSSVGHNGQRWCAPDPSGPEQLSAQPFTGEVHAGGVGLYQQNRQGS